MKNGISPSQISKLDELGIKPDQYNDLEIISGEEARKVIDAAEGAAEAVGKFTANLKVNNIITKSADEVNEWWRTVKGYTNPPYTPGKTVLEFELGV